MQPQEAASHPSFGRWPQIRAGLLAAVIFFQAIVAAPVPSPVSEKTLRNPIARDEMRRWSEILSIPEPQLEEIVFRESTRSHRLQKAVLRPFGLFFRLSGTGQSWGLFAYPNAWPHRLVIAASEDGDNFEILFRANDAEHRWLAPQLHDRHIRGVFDDNTTKLRPSYDNFVDWVARNAMSERPEIQVVKVYMERFNAVPPGRAAKEGVDIRMERKRTRVEVMP